MKRKLAGAVLAVTALAGFAVPALAAPTRQLSVHNFFYSPKNVSISRGTAVTWTWQHTNGIRHDVSVANGPSHFASRKQTSGTFSHTFNRSGIYHLICTVHPNMTETITVH